MNEEKLIIKALSHWKKIDAVTYLGLRSFLDNKIDIVKYSQQLINRKAMVNKEITFRKFKIFKKKENDKNIYRDFYSLSPLNALIESNVINLLQENYQIKSTRIYSYISASSNSSYMYQYYRNGYEQREIDIFNEIKQNKDLVLNIFDITNFYPSVNNQHILNKLSSNLNSSKESKEVILPFFEKLYKDIKGLPIGPASSHFLASIALEEIDKFLEEKYKNFYFRYVDDIIILSSKNKSGEIKLEIQNLLEKYGFSSNKEKYLIGKSKEWLKYHQYYFSEAFGSYIDRLKFFLYRNEKDFDLIKNKFIEEGFNFSFIQMQLNNKEIDPLYFLKNIFKRNSIIKKIFPLDNLDKLLTDGKNLRFKIFSEASYFISNFLPMSKYEEKLFSQKINYYYSRLIQLYSPFYYNDLLKVFENHINDEKKMTLFFLNKKKYDELLNLNGSAVYSLINYLNETNTKIDISSKDLYDEEKIDSIVQLAAYDRLNLIDNDSENINENIKLINYLMGKNNLIREKNNLSYYDELNSLLLGKKNDQLQSYLKNKYSKFEKIHSNGYYYL